MEKKPYIKPDADRVVFDYSIQVVASGACHEDKPGWGWGDQNHNHYGPPGQNKKYKWGN